MQIEPEWYIQACMYDFCSLNGENPEDDERVVCHYLTAYAMEAAKNGIRLVNWRRPGLCGMLSVARNSVYT